MGRIPNVKKPPTNHQTMKPVLVFIPENESCAPISFQSASGTMKASISIHTATIHPAKMSSPSNASTR